MCLCVHACVEVTVTLEYCFSRAIKFGLVFFVFWFLFLFLFLFLFFWDRVSLCSPGCPGTHFVGQAGLELRNSPASASQVLGLKVCATTVWQLWFFETLRISPWAPRGWQACDPHLKSLSWPPWLWGTAFYVGVRNQTLVFLPGKHLALTYWVISSVCRYWF